MATRLKIVPTKADLQLSARRHKYINRMFELVDEDQSKYDQGNFPTPTVETGVCGAPFCAAGFLVLAKSQALFKRLCLRSLEVIQTVDDFSQASLWTVWASAGSKLLGIRDSVESYTDASRLFGMPWGWPSRYAKMYQHAKTDAGRVRAFKAQWRNWLKQQDREAGIL